MAFTDKILALFVSRRFWTAVSGVIVVSLQDTLGMSEEAALSVAAMLIAWIIGDSINTTK